MLYLLNAWSDGWKDAWAKSWPCQVTLQGFPSSSSHATLCGIQGLSGQVPNQAAIVTQWPTHALHPMCELPVSSTARRLRREVRSTVEAELCIDWMGARAHVGERCLWFTVPKETLPLLYMMECSLRQRWPLLYMTWNMLACLLSLTRALTTFYLGTWLKIPRLHEFQLYFIATDLSPLDNARIRVFQHYF